MLVIDDDVQVCLVIRLSLEEHGYEVVDAQSLADARRLLATDVWPDVILLDVRLPDGDGRDYRTELAGDADGLGTIPIVVMSAVPDKVFVPDPFVAKPFQGDDIVRAVAAADQAGAGSTRP